MFVIQTLTIVVRRGYGYFFIYIAPVFMFTAMLSYYSGLVDHNFIFLQPIEIGMYLLHLQTVGIGNIKFVYSF